MKSKILSVIALSVVIWGISKSSYAAPVTNANFTVVNDVNNINKIEIRGNVELYISDGSADQVKVYNHYYSESALVQSKKGLLRITSYTAEKLVVWVTANDLRSISAYDNAEVKSFGKLSKIDFDIDLHNNASAMLNLDAYDANLTLTDYSKADLMGTADEFSLYHNETSTVKNSNLSAVHFTENKIKATDLVENQDIATL